MDKKIVDYFEDSNIKYELIKHKTVYTALDKAATLHVDPKSVLKTVVIEADRENYFLVAIPCHRNFDKKSFLRVLNSKRKKEGKDNFEEINFVSEDWMKKRIKNCKVGAIFFCGLFWELETAVDNLAFRQKNVVISAGDYNHSFVLTKPMFEKLIGKNVIRGSFSLARK